MQRRERGRAARVILRSAVQASVRLQAGARKRAAVRRYGVALRRVVRWQQLAR